MSHSKKLSSGQAESLLSLLKTRLAKHPSRHRGIDWNAVEERLQANPEKLWSLHQMESTGGEPDVIGVDEKTKSIIFIDCSLQSPKGRRGLCYDNEALEARKEHKPVGSAMEWAAKMGIELLNEEQYRHLQIFGPFDTTTSSWLLTPDGIRKRGGALFGDYRYGQVFIYHNGAESYYGARGFRGMLRL